MQELKGNATMPVDCFFQLFPHQPTALLCGFSTSHCEYAASSMCVWAGEWLSGEMRQCGFTAMRNLPDSMSSLIRPAPLSVPGALLLEDKAEKHILGIFYRSWKVWGTTLWAAFIFDSSYKPYHGYDFGKGLWSRELGVHSGLLLGKKPAAACDNRAL